MIDPDKTEPVMKALRDDVPGNVMNEAYARRDNVAYEEMLSEQANKKQTLPYGKLALWIAVIAILLALSVACYHRFYEKKEPARQTGRQMIRK